MPVFVKAATRSHERSSPLRPQLEPITANLRAIDFSNPSVLSLLANSIPLLGVLFFGWNLFAIVAVYWTENVIIGAINVLKIAVCAPLAESVDVTALNDAAVRERFTAKLTRDANERATFSTIHHASKLFLIPFFIAHYALFCFVHGVFVFELLGGGFGSFVPGQVARSAWQRFHEEHLQWAVLAVGLSHLISFIVNFLYRGEYQQASAFQLMMQPYGRVVVLHLAILLGALAVMALRSPVWMLTILVVGKTILDVGLHQAEHAIRAAHEHALPAKQRESETVI